MKQGACPIGIGLECVDSSKWLGNGDQVRSCVSNIVQFV